MRLIHLSVASLLLIAGLTQAALAQGQRYPTARAMQNLSQQFKRKLPRLKNDPTRTYRDWRTPAERQQRETFVQSWASFDPSVATFLGGWTAIEESMLICPSRTKGQVCIIKTFIPGAKDSGFAFTLGKVVRGQVQTGDRNILIKQDAFLGSAGVYNGKAGLYEYANPRPLQNPATVDYFQRVPSIVSQFKQAGCTAAYPGRKIKR